MKAIIQVLLLVIAFPYVRTLSCPTNCSKENCEDPTDCQGSVVLDDCKCCKTCAKLEGETCGGKFNIQGPCDEGLVCVKTKKLSDTGTCRRAPVEDLCKKKKCGFRQQCTINKHGRAVCICPRNCRESKGRPVCGYKNGKQYRNPCELYRHECRSGKEIGRFNGPCKKCYHHGKPYRLGEARRGQAPCEKCICYHGDWICKTKHHCQDRIDFCTVFRDPKGDLSSTCPPGYWCKVQIPSIPEQNIPGVGRCASSKSDDANSSTGTTLPSNVSTTTAVTKTKTGDATNPCDLPLQVGPCRASILRWYYNKSRRKCVKFVFGGCGANANNFPTKSSCRNRCMRRRGQLVKTTASIATRPTKTATTSTTTENPKTIKPTGRSLNMTVLCNLPPAPGPCRAAMPQWYYNPKKQRCMRFIYGGCGGNDNNFDTKDECKKACMRNKGTMPPFPTESSTRMTSDSKPSANNTSSTSQTTSSTNTAIHTLPTTKTTKISTTTDNTQATQEKQPFRCACSECPSINGKGTCETHYGCFTSQLQHADGTQIIRYGCFGSEEHYLITCYVKIPFKKHPKMFVECCKGHMCNQPPVRSRTDVSQTLNSKPNTTSPTSQTTSSTNTAIHTLPTTKTTKISTTADNTQATQEKQPFRCACSECPFFKDTCETHYGCFTSQIQHADGTQTVKYGCTANMEHYLATCNVKIPFKKHPKMLLECCKGHMCNQPPVRSRTDVSQTLNKPITTPTQATVVKETASTEIPRCFDAHSSKFYGENEEWKPNDCTVCACHDGHPECVATVCRHPNCVEPIRVKGQCCPVCTANGNATEDSEDMIKALAQSELTTVLVSIKKDKDKRFCEDMNSGELYTVGQNWKVDDCTTCYCQRDGKIACAVQMCNGYPGCSNPVKEKGHCCPVCPEEPEEELVSPENEVINSPHSCLDSVTGDYYRLGEMWQQDDCTGCTCRTGRKSQCRKSTCRKLSCTKTIHLKGRCCPACEDDAKSGCIFEGQKYLPGEYKLLSDHCTLCECKNLEWHCSSRKCRKNLIRG